MPSFKWMFRLTILLSFAWIAFGQSQPPNPNGAPPTGIDAVLAKVTRAVNGLRDQAIDRAVAELRERGIVSDAFPINSKSISEFQNKAASAVREVRQQIATNLGQNGEVNVQALLNKASQLDEQQIVSQLQTGFARIVQQTGSPNPELRLNPDNE